ncbi:hypothetical protein BGZ95_003200 [Linnemannia exigua]|uniref:Uncharacterized protein n=1 Tax=Linnemannia exigua TaxID=604196 RepID=A0AAD4D4Y8_9FUNG|nr:hypothetical protein BGZ95_003200 [Linnemannia exigua]
MHKSILLLATLACSSVAFASHVISVKNNDGSKSQAFEIPDNTRYCLCVSGTQTAQIDGRNGGQVRLFGKSDCTGNFVDGAKVTGSAQWVNSISFGRSGIPSQDWGVTCKWY